MTILFVMLLYLMKKRLPAGASVPEVGSFHASLYKHLVYTLSGACVGMIVLMLLLHAGSAGYRGPDCAFESRGSRYEPVTTTIHDVEIRLWGQQGGCTEEAVAALIHSYNTTVCAAERLATASSILRRKNKTSTVAWDGWTTFRAGRARVKETKEFTDRATVMDNTQVLRTSRFVSLLP